MGLEAVHLFIHVNLHGVKRRLRADAVAHLFARELRIGRKRLCEGFLEALRELCLRGGDDVRHALLHGVGDGVDLDAVVSKNLGKRRAFTLAAFRKRGERCRKEPRHDLCEFFRIRVFQAHDAGIGEDFRDAHRAGAGEGFKNGSLQVLYKGERRGIDAAARFRELRLHVGANFNLAAAHGLGDRLADGGLRALQFVGRAQREIEKARIDAADLETDDAERGRRLRGRITRHGRNLRHG